MQLHFKNDYYFNKAINVLSKNEINFKNKLEKEDALLVLLKDVPSGDLSNLCNELSKQLNITIDDAYKLVQNSDNYKYQIFSIALNLVQNNIYLGNNQDGKFNTSSWISHSINAALVAYNLANMLNLDSDYAFVYGLLHDFGRKYIHNFNHVVKGFEELVDLGLEEEAKACLTHSFINGGRYCSMEPACKGFYLNHDNKEKYEDELQIDDLSKVLKFSKYTDYDRILNIADLMATASGAVSSKNRIKDILTRRENLEEAPNWKYFLVSYYNLLVYILNKLDNNLKLIEIDMNLSLEKTKELLWNISDMFYNMYKEKDNNQILIKRK